MKKQILKYIASIGVCGMLMVAPTGCQDALDLEPLDVVSDVNYWKQPTDFKLAANKFYNYLRTFGNGNGDGHGGTDLGADRGALVRGTNTPPARDDN